VVIASTNEDLIMDSFFNHKIILSFPLLIFALFATCNVHAEKNSDFSSLPPFAGLDIKPNVIIAMDISGSMKTVAYREVGAGAWQSAMHTDYDSDTDYFGYFDSGKTYIYDFGYSFFRESVAGDDSNKLWSGNFLNWLSMRRIDIIRKVMVGGKVSVKTLDQDCSEPWTDANGNDKPDTGEYTDTDGDGRCDCSLTYGQIVPINRNLARTWTADAGFTDWEDDWDNYWVLEGQNEPYDYSFRKRYNNSNSEELTPTEYPDNQIFVIEEGKIIPSTDESSYQVKISDEVEMGMVTTNQEVDASGVETVWIEMHFINEYTDPVVVAKSVSYNGGDPVMARVKDVTGGAGGGFKVALQEWNVDDGNHTDEQIMFVVAEAGTHDVDLDDGSKLTFNSQVIDNFSSCGYYNFESKNYSGSYTFSDTPLLFTGVSTYTADENGSDESDDLHDPVVTRNKDVTTTGFKVVLQEEEKYGSLDCSHADEEVHVIAVSPGSGTTSDTSVPIEVVAPADTLDQKWTTIDFANTYSDTPLLVSDMQTTEGSDTCNLRHYKLDSSSFEIQVDEEKSDDNETTHSNNESFGYIAVEGFSGYNIRVGLTDEPTGLIQDMSDSMRFGLAVYNYDHDKSTTSIYTGNTVNGGNLYPSYPDVNLHPDDRTNYDVSLSTGVHDPVENILRVIEEHPLIWGTTPITETLWEIKNYLQQNDSDGNASNGGDGDFDDKSDNPTYPYGGVGSDQDPYYYEEYGSVMHCADTFILHFNDGEPYEDWDSSVSITFTGNGDTATGKNEWLDDLAYRLRHDDLRTDADMTGHQEAISYYVYAALGENEQYDTKTETLRQAAVYGGFEDDDGDHDPDPDLSDPPEKNINNYAQGSDCTENEWDKDGDCEPDTFYYANDGYQLEDELRAAFVSILKRVSSGTAASVISNSRSGEGAAYQSIFFPGYVDDNGETINWTGELHALLIDDYGNMREDTNGNKQLDTEGTRDLIVVFDGENVYKYDDANENNLIDDEDDTDFDPDIPAWHNNGVLDTEDTNGNGELDDGEDLNGNDELDYEDANGNGVIDTEQVSGTFTIYDIKYLWSSTDWLNATDMEPVSQRVYTDTLKKRYIFTFADIDSDGIVDSGEQKEFSAAYLVNEADMNDSSNFYRYLTLYPSFSDKPDWVSYIEGDGNLTGDSGLLMKQTEREIKWIRGEDQGELTIGTRTVPAMRSRQYNDDGTDKTWRLGDIVYSSPTVVDSPAESYDEIYYDDSYTDFAARYQKRRSVIYVGGNDGMIHAFNGGFYDSDTSSFKTAIAEPYTDLNENGSYESGEPYTDWNDNGSWDGATQTQYALGAELWAYVPYNLLPHLYWLTEDTYDHVYYNDLKPKIFDAKVFYQADGVTPLDGDHPDGWGTVMVVGMRLGGGLIQADLNKTDGDSYIEGTDRKMGSAYVVFDITNPEVEPKVLAEIRLDKMGYTTCFPAVIPMRDYDESTSNPGGENNWYLVFGSGPADDTGLPTGRINDPVDDPDVDRVLDEGISFQKSKLFVLDLKEMAVNKVIKTLDVDGSPTTTAPYYIQEFDDNEYISQPITVDFDLDFKDDVVYFGTVQGNKDDGWGGKLRRLIVNNESADASTGAVTWTGSLGGVDRADNVLIDLTTAYNGQPISAAPTSAIGDSIYFDTDGDGTPDEENYERWVFFGTGRFITRLDAANSDQQSYYGIKEPYDDTEYTWATVSRGDLIDISLAKVYDDETVNNVAGVTDWDSLKDAIEDASGWYLDFPAARERNLSQASLLGELLTFSTYIPSEDICSIEGESWLYALYYSTGTSYYESVVGWEFTDKNGDSFLQKGEQEMIEKLYLGKGMAASPNIHTGREEGSTAYIQTSTGAIETIQQINPGITKSGKTSWREIRDD